MKVRLIRAGAYPEARRTAGVYEHGAQISPDDEEDQQVEEHKDDIAPPLF